MSSWYNVINSMLDWGYVYSLVIYIFVAPN